jgi:flagellin-like protein
MGKKYRSAIKRGFDDTAVSEVIGSILLVAIVVTAASIVGVVLWSQPPPQKIPAFDVIISKDTANHKVHLYHNGGDSITSDEITILVDGNDKKADFTKSGASWTTWSTGESLDYNYSGQPEPRDVQIIYIGLSSSSILAAAHF